MTFTVDLEWTAHIYAQLSRDICVLLVVLPTVPLPTCCIALQPTVFRAGQVLGTASPCNLRLKDKWRGMTLVVLIIMLITTWLWLHLHFLALTFLISCTRSILEKGTWRFMVIPHAYDLWQYLGSDHMEAEFMLCELQDLRQERRRHYNTACTRWAEFVWHDVSEEWRQNFLYDMAPEVDTPAILLKQIFGSSSS